MIGPLTNEEDKMAAAPQVWCNLSSHSQSGKGESKEVKLPYLRKPKDKLIGHQRKDESPKNNGNKFLNTYLEDKRTMRGPLQMAKKKEFEKGEEVLLLSPNRGSPFDGRYLGPYVVSQKIEERTSNRYPRGKEEDTSVSYKQTKEICPSRMTACAGSSHREQNSGKEGGASSEKPASQA